MTDNKAAAGANTAAERSKRKVREGVVGHSRLGGRERSESQSMNALGHQVVDQ